MHILTLPDRHGLNGPITRRRLVRLLLIYIAFYAIGQLFFQFASTAPWQAFGLGLMAPGGGFMAYAGIACWQGIAHLFLAGFAFMLFMAAVLLWFATGNVLLPPLIWIMMAYGATFMDHGPVRIGSRDVAITTILVVASVACVVLFRRFRQDAARKEANRYLADSAPLVAAKIADTAYSPDSEFSFREVNLMRFLLDRALQPLSEFEGFEWLDQFQTAAVRYQLHFAGYALSMAQSTRLPAMRGYLEEAQLRLIQKQTDHRIWRYWQLENLWGNLKSGRDPNARGNIMYSGFGALQIALFHSASGRRDFNQPGSFTLTHPDGTAYVYDLPKLTETLRRQYLESPFHLLPCEPNWIYPLCNSITASALHAQETMSGTPYWTPQAETFRRYVEDEFIDLHGRFVPCRSSYTGLALPMIGGAMPQAMPSFFLNAILPDMALRQWLLLRRTLIDASGRLRMKSFWPIDTGNYGFSYASAFAATALAAVELGDDEIAELCLAELDKRNPIVESEDAWFRSKASVWAHAVEMIARSGGKNRFRSLIENPVAARTGPAIQHVNYPDVLVARAVSQGETLTGVFYPGDAPGRQPVTLCGLIPERAYYCEGTESPHLLADRQGCGVVHVVLEDRTEVVVRPVT